MSSGMWNSFICETLQRTPANEINDTPHGHQGDDKTAGYLG